MGEGEAKAFLTMNLMSKKPDPAADMPKGEDENSFQRFPRTAPQEDRYQTLADDRQAILRVKEGI
jgi:hypothetical protein